MTKTAISAENILSRFLAIQSAWGSIDAEYDGADPLIRWGEPGWGDLTELNCLFQHDLASVPRDFARAWASVLIRARKLFVSEFVPWAADVVGLYGIKHFPIDCGDPPWPEGARFHHSQPTLPQLLTRSSDPSVAGSRLILWAAAHRVPQLCHRSDEYHVMMWQWVVNLVDFDSGKCRTLQEPFEWVATALNKWSEDSDRQLESAQAGSKKKRFTEAEANERLGELLKKTKNRKKTLTVREAAKAIGCVPSLICKTSLWKAYRKTIAKKPKAPKVVGLSGEHEATLGREDDELNRLVREQAKDFEPSPLAPQSSRTRPPRRRQL